MKTVGKAICFIDEGKKFVLFKATQSLTNWFTYFFASLNCLSKSFHVKQTNFALSNGQNCFKIRLKNGQKKNILKSLKYEKIEKSYPWHFSRRDTFNKFFRSHFSKGFNYFFSPFFQQSHLTQFKQKYRALMTKQLFSWN